MSKNTQIATLETELADVKAAHAALLAEAEELRKLKVQQAQVVANRVRKQRVVGLGLVLPGECLPRMEYQDRLFEENEKGWLSVDKDGNQRLVHFTDAQLLILNHVEHPMCEGRMELDTIRAMRRLYNEGRHSKRFGIPAVKSRQYTAKDCEPAVEVAPVTEPVADEPVIENVG